ncbi:MAG: hypothetical protein AAF074_04470 [Pseudomonadota bacterium]
MKLLPILLVAVALIAGAFGGEALRPAEDMEAEGGEAGEMTEDGEAKEGKDGEKAEDKAEEKDGEAAERTVVDFNRRLIVPIVTDRQTESIVLLDVSIDVPISAQERAYDAVPKLRDRFLRVLLGLSAAGAFQSGIVDPRLIDRIRSLLQDRAKEVLPGVDTEVLILEVLIRDV